MFFLKNKHHEWKHFVKIFSAPIRICRRQVYTWLYVTLLLYKFLFCCLSRHPTKFSFLHNKWNSEIPGDILQYGMTAGKFGKWWCNGIRWNCWNSYFPHGTLPAFCFLWFCKNNMKQNRTFSSVGEIAAHVYLVIMTCKIFSHGLELEGS